MGENVLPPTLVDVGDTPDRRPPALLRLNHTHEAIARWLLENPTQSYGACAKYFGYSQSWLSIIIHSDAFQNRLRRLHDEADAVVVLDVPTRLRGVAAAALDGLGQQVDHALQDGNGVLHRQFLKETAEMTLKALGYGQPKATPAPTVGSTHYHNHQHVTVDAKTLGKAREKLLEAHEVQEASQLPAGGSSDLSSVQRQTTLIPTPSPTEGSETARSDLSGSGGSVAQ